MCQPFTPYTNGRRGNRHDTARSVQEFNRHQSHFSRMLSPSQGGRKSVLAVLLVPSVERDGTTAIDQQHWVDAGDDRCSASSPFVVRHDTSIPVSPPRRFGGRLPPCGMELLPARAESPPAGSSARAAPASARTHPESEDSGNAARSARDVARHRPDVPDGEWYKRTSGMTVCGEGELMKTLLLPGQAPKGKRVP
jgi:hypothetical protein